MHMLNISWLKVRKHLFNSLTEKDSTFLLGICHHEAIHVSQRHLGRLHVLLIIGKDIQELDCVNWQVHVNMVRFLVLFLVIVFLPIDLSHCLPSTHIPAFYAVFYFVQLGIPNKVLMAVGIQIISNDIEAFFGSSDGQGPNTTKDIRQQLSTIHSAQDSISFLLKPGAPIDFFEVKLKLHSLFSQPHEIVSVTRHMLQGRSTINVVQFLSLVHYCFDVRAFQKGYFSNDFSKGLLLISQIVVSHMTNCLEAIREWDIAFFAFFFIGKPLKDFLIFAILIVQLDLGLLNDCFFSLVLWDIIHLKGFIDKDDLLVWVLGEDSLETMQLMGYLGISRTFPIFLSSL